MNRPATGTGHDDVAERAQSGGSESGGIGAFQRVLLLTDGTVVRLLEGFFDEVIGTHDVVQEVVVAPSADPELELSGGERLLRRKAVLQGLRSGRNYVYAEASLVLDRLPERVRVGLLESDEPIGRLLIAERLETFRELLRTGRRSAAGLAAIFGAGEEDDILFRTYRIFAGRRAVMAITEYFPPVYDDAPRPENNGKGPHHVRLG